MHPNVLTCHTIVLCNRVFEHILSTPATINLSRQVTARYPGTVDKELALAFPSLLFAWESGTSDVANLSQRQKHRVGIGRLWSKPKHSLALLQTQPAGAVRLQTDGMIPFNNRFVFCIPRTVPRSDRCPGKPPDVRGCQIFPRGGQLLCFRVHINDRIWKVTWNCFLFRDLEKSKSRPVTSMSRLRLVKPDAIYESQVLLI